jgi:hypothetical protein
MSKLTAASNRQKQMMRLMHRYAQLINEYNWILPYVYDVVYVNQDTGQEDREEHICHTDNMAFAAMIFEGKKLPLKIRIVGICVAGLEREMEEIITKESVV